MKTAATNAAVSLTGSPIHWASMWWIQLRAWRTPPVQIIFDMTNHPTRMRVIESLQGKRGFLALTRLAIESYEGEEYLLFSGFDEGGASLDQETMEKLFGCAGRVDGGDTMPAAARQRLAAEADRHAKATASRSLEAEQRTLQPGAGET